MKKFLILGIIVFIFLLNGFFASKITIPEDSIRFRVIAEDNSKEAQEVKWLVSDALEEEVSSRLDGVKNLDDASLILEASLPVFQERVERVLKENKVDTSFKIHYGMNYFPEKVYKGVTYKEGEYQSLVVTLGSGEGNNWWCVLFPPLCLMEAEETSVSDIEYHFFLKDLLDKYF